jgi:fluoride exporter
LIKSYAWIGLGSAIGGMARYWCYGAMVRLMGAAFPWGTLTVNLVGCTFIGFFATIASPDGRLLVAPATRQFVMVGICGGFTTFSTFGLETLNLARDGEWAKAAANVLASVLLCLVGVWLGHVAGNLLNER